AVAKGGRYDAIGSDFGRARPATGFSLDIRALVTLGDHSVSPSKAVWAPAVNDEALEKAISELRVTDTVVRALPEDNEVDPSNRGCDRKLVQQGDHWVVQKLS
ncbi:MAG: ATP phosphoribosyltransferase regulatory subunit, partial [Marinobacter sp.]